MKLEDLGLPWIFHYPFKSFEINRIFINESALCIAPILVYFRDNNGKEDELVVDYMSFGSCFVFQEKEIK